MSYNQMVPQQLQGQINPKSRKPYTITKQRENWTEEEHQKFLEALTLFDRDWKKIEGFVGTKTVIQIRSHAQKYFIKVQKNNTGERIPPPRPKRKSVQPYPQKAKSGDIMAGMGMGGMLPDNLTGNPFISPSNFTSWMAYRGLMPPMDMNGIGGGGGASASPTPPSSMDVNRHHLEQLQQAQQYIQSALSVAQTGGRSQSSPGGGTTSTTNTATGASSLSAPNYPKIYSFLSTLFDSNQSTYADSLNEMSQTDRETMQLLMHNLAINLANQQYRDQHQSLIDQCRSLKREDDEEISSPRQGGGATTDTFDTSNLDSSYASSTAQSLYMANMLNNHSHNHHHHQHHQTNLSNLNTLNALTSLNNLNTLQLNSLNTLNMSPNGGQGSASTSTTTSTNSSSSTSSGGAGANNTNSALQPNSLNQMGNLMNLNSLQQSKSFILNPPQTTF